MRNACNPAPPYSSQNNGTFFIFLLSANLVPNHWSGRFWLLGQMAQGIGIRGLSGFFTGGRWQLAGDENINVTLPV